MELEGKVIAVLTPREGVSKAGNQWKAQEYVIETMEQYPKKMCFEIFGSDKIAQNESLLQVGKEVKVSFDIDAREWNGRWFNSIRAWRIDPKADAPMADAGAEQVASVDAFPAASGTTTTDDGATDDLPF